MTQLSNRSRGIAHSLAVKRGQMRLRETPFSAVVARRVDRDASRAARNVGVFRAMLALLGKVNVPIPDPQEIERELRAAFKRGYVQALRDVKHEREKQDAQSYHEAMPVAAMQDARQISHAYNRPNA